MVYAPTITPEEKAEFEYEARKVFWRWCWPGDHDVGSLRVVVGEWEDTGRYVPSRQAAYVDLDHPKVLYHELGHHKVWRETGKHCDPDHKDARWASWNWMMRPRRGH